MSVSTTLMTFLVRVPPTTRSVSLLGSWDNFTIPYVMHRDSRIGAEHWTGCHNFQNIICDGTGSAGLVSRDGGLKMGGTYWYYYKLDDDIEFHNSAEPSTTSCPLLPGQLVNVLHVPFSLTSGRPRNASTSSAVSEIRTMNPEDKFMNPRPVPQPQLHRLNTSPTLPAFPLSSTSSLASGSPWSARFTAASREASPTSASSLKMFRVPRKVSSAGKSRSTSPGRDRVAGIKATIRSFRSPRSGSPEGDLNRGRRAEGDRGVDISQPIIDHRPFEDVASRPETRTGLRRLPESRSRSPRPTVDPEAPAAMRDNLAVRRGLDQPSDIDPLFTPSSFQQHRRHRSLSRDPSPLRRSISLSEDRQLKEAIASLSINRGKALETVKESNSYLNTPQWPITAIKIPNTGDITGQMGSENESTPSEQETMQLSLTTLCMEKRLPTLPNTPSSAYPPSAMDDSPSKRLSAQLLKMDHDLLLSHFSNSTASHDSAIGNIQTIERSHFSAWTASSWTASPTSDHFSQLPPLRDAEAYPATEVKLPEFPPRGQSLHPGNHEKALAGLMTHSDTLPSTTSFSTIASSASTSPFSEQFEFLDRSERSKSIDLTLATHPKHIQTYQLPQDESVPAVKTSKPMFQDFVNNINTAKQRDIVGEVQPTENTNQLLPHSESMQQLINELSYLRTLIEG